MRCVIWAAVSSPGQASEEKDSIPSQIEAARELIQRSDGWHEVQEPLVIPGHSRSYIFLADAAADMPVYTDLMQLARQGEIDLLVCRGRDRLGRTDALIAQIEEYLASYNVQVLSLSMPTKIQEPGEFAAKGNRPAIWMRSIERAKSQDEVAELRARHRMGMRKRIKSGLHASKVPYGYRLGPDGYGVPHPAEASVVRLLARWTLEGLPYREMLRRLPSHASGHHPTSVTMIQQVLRNPYYRGAVAYHRKDRKTHRWRDRSQWLVAPGLHEGILDEDIWERVQAEMDARRRQGSRAAVVIRPLSGFLFCAECGEGMIIRGGNPDYGYMYYACENCADRDGVHRNTIRDDVAHQALIDWLLERALKPELLAEELDHLRSANLDDAQGELRSLSQVVGSKRAALERYRRDYEEGWLDRTDYYTNKLRLEEELAGAESRLLELQRRHDAFDVERLEQAISAFPPEAIRRLRQDWRQPDVARPLKALLRQLGIRVECTNSSLSIALARAS